MTPANWFEDYWWCHSFFSLLPTELLREELHMKQLYILTHYKRKVRVEINFPKWKILYVKCCQAHLTICLMLLLSITASSKCSLSMICYRRKFSLLSWRFSQSISILENCQSTSTSLAQLRRYFDDWVISTERILCFVLYHVPGF